MEAIEMEIERAERMGRVLSTVAKALELYGVNGAPADIGNDGGSEDESWVRCLNTLDTLATKERLADLADVVNSMAIDARCAKESLEGIMASETLG